MTLTLSLWQNKLDLNFISLRDDKKLAYSYLFLGFKLNERDNQLMNRFFLSSKRQKSKKITFDKTHLTPGYLCCEREHILSWETISQKRTYLTRPSSRHWYESKHILLRETYLLNFWLVLNIIENINFFF